MKHQTVAEKHIEKLEQENLKLRKQLLDRVDKHLKDIVEIARLREKLEGRR